VEEATVPRNAQLLEKNVQNVTNYILFARVCRSRHNPTDSQPANIPIPKSQVTCPKNVFELKDSESYTSDSESNLLIDPVRIDGLTKPYAWQSTLSKTQGNITLKLDTGGKLIAQLILVSKQK